MGSIPGPIISFRVSSDISGAIRPALDQIKREAKTASTQIADDWRRMAAQLRATVAQGALPEKEILASRKEIVSVLDKEITGLRTRNELTKGQLSNLKAATLELERQSSLVKGGSGLTAGTLSFANLISGYLQKQTAFLGSNLFGVSGGSQLAGGAASAILGSVSGRSVSSLLSETAAQASAATIAVSGVAASIVALGVAAAASAKDLIAQNEAFKNTSAVTGLSTREVQGFNEAAKLLGLDSSTITTSLARLQAELGKFIVSGKDSESATQNFVKVLDKFGVSVTDTGGKLRPASQIIGDLATALKGIPDPATRTAIAMDALGVRGRALAPLLVRDDINFQNLLSTIDKSGVIIGSKMTRTLDAGEESMRKFRLEVDAAKIKTEQFLASGFFSGVHIVRMVIKSFTDPKQAAADFQKEKDQQFRINVAKELGPLGAVPTQSSSTQLISDTESFYDKQYEGALRYQQTIEAGGKQEVALQELRKQYEEAIAGKHTEQAAMLLKQVNTLRSAIDLEKSRAAINERIYRLVGEGKLSGTPKKTPLTPDQIIDKILNPPPGAPELGFPTLSGPGVAGVPGVTGGLDALSQARAKGLIDQINKEHDDLFITQREKDIQHYEDEQKDLQFSLDQKLISQEQYNEALKKLKEDENKTLLDADKKYVDEAGKIFDDILSGNGKKIGKAIEKDLLEAVLAPIKKIFSEQFGSLLGNLSRTVSIPLGGSSGSGAAPSGGLRGILGGIFGPIIGNRIGPGGTAGFWPGAVNAPAGAGTGIGVQAGQVGVATQTMNVTASVVNVYGLLGLPGATPLGSSTGNFFGNLNPFASNFGGGSGLPGFGSLGTGGSGGLGGPLASLGPYLGGGALIGAGIASNNPTAMALGAASLAQAGIKSLTSFGGLISSSSGLGQSLGKIAPGLPGIGMFAAGVAQGGVSGTLEATLGGAQAGGTYGGPIGAAIGAGVGLISGIVSTLIQGPSFEQRVKQDMRRQAITLPPSETFSFAMGSSIGQTLSTGAAQSGSTFSAFGLPSNTPFFANPIHGPLTRKQQRELQQEQEGLLSNQPFLGFPGTDPFIGQGPVGRRHGSPTPVTHITIQAMDSQSFNDFINRNGNNHAIARAVAPLGGLSSTGQGSSVRRMAFLP
jgi:hypothetical protein